MASKKPAATVTLSSLLLLLLVASGATAARPTRQLTSGGGGDDDTGAAAAAAVAPAAAPTVAPVAADAPTAANAIPAAAGAAGAAASGGAAAAPVAASTIPVGAGAAVANPTGDHGMVFFMHDILGGTNPSARIVAGIVDNAAVTGQLPFARPNGAVLPLSSGVNVNSGAASAIDNNNIPFLTGLGGATNAVKSINNNNNNNGGNGVPIFAGGSLPQGTTLQKLLFGTMTVVDDELTEAPELGSAAVGRAQGFYIASSEEGVSQTVAVTAMFKEGGFDDTISFFGVHRTADSESHLAIVGGTGKYVGAKGFAKVAVVRPGGVVASGALLETDGVETVLQFTVFLV
ncbi:dirigent protein 10 [Setaria italica]|uniref:dirigent protein 10 n=1 Tax=Setaria italica TaxID=4555 RepID=UPI000350C984|nr:dirigent protein 10 [Setaria italica]